MIEYKAKDLIYQFITFAVSSIWITVPPVVVATSIKRAPPVCGQLHVPPNDFACKLRSIKRAPSNAASVQQILSQKRKKCPLSGHFQNLMRPVLFIFHITRRLTFDADCRLNRCTVSSRIALIRYAVEPKDALSTSSQTSTSD